MSDTTETPSTEAPPTTSASAPAVARTGKKRALILGGVGALVVACAVGAFAVYRLRAPSFALAPQQIPAGATTLSAEQIDESVLEESPELRRIERALSIGTFGCSVSEGMLTRLRDADDDDDVRQYVDGDSRTAIAKKMKCALRMSDAFKATRAHAAEVKTDDDKEHPVLLLQGAADALPPELSEKSGTLSGVKAFCLAADPVSPPDAASKTPEAEKKKDPCEAADAPFAAHHDGKWLFGARAAVESMLRSAQNPSSETPTAVASLMDGLSAIPAEFVTRKALAVPEGEAMAKMLVNALVAAPCARAGVSCGDLLPKKPMEAVASRARVVAFGRQSPREVKTFAYRLAFVARDEEQARALEADLREAVTSFRDKIADSETKLRNEAKSEGKKSPDARVAEVLMDPFFSAMRGARVERSGRVATFSIDTPIGEAQRKEITELLTKQRTDPRRKAALTVLQLAADDKAPTSAHLEPLLGKELASYALIPRVSLNKDECSTLEKHLEEVTETEGWRWLHFCYGEVSVPKCVVDAADHTGVLACVNTPAAAERVQVGADECKLVNEKLEKAKTAAQRAIRTALLACNGGDATLQQPYYTCLKDSKTLAAAAACSHIEKPAKPCRCDAGDPSCDCAKTAKTQDER